MVSLTSLFIIASSCIQLTYSIVSLKDISELIRLFGNPRYPRSERESVNIIHVPEECRNKTYCTIMPKNYPQERFNKLFENKTVIPQPSLHAVDAILTNRVGGLEDDYDACETEIDNKPLSMVRDPNTNKWRLVVQAPEQDYRQYIYLALCKNKYAKCQLNELLPYSITSYCKQSYMTVRLLVAKGLSDTEIIYVPLPACCSCSCKIK